MGTKKHPCADCLHYNECFERRGRCTEYKTLSEVRKEIEMLNKEARIATRSEDNHENGTQ